MSVPILTDGLDCLQYEGVMTKGFASNETDAAVMANIVAAGYGA